MEPSKHTKKEGGRKGSESSQAANGADTPLSTSPGIFGFVSCKRSTRFGGFFYFFQAPSSKGQKRGHKQRLHPPRCRDQSRFLSKDKMNVYIVRKRD